MASNLERINNILNYFKGIVKENENITITEDMVYDYLMRYGVPFDEYNKDTTEFFKEWKSECRKLGNIKDLDIDFSVYCLFSDDEEKIEKCPNPIKLYIPIKYSHIKESVNKLLAFFSKKKMPFEMKIANKVRTDDIIVRLYSLEDVNKFLNFIKYNEYINEGLLKPNPFCYQEESIALTNDGSISYIQVIASYISRYINSNKDNIDDIKLHKFYNYIIDCYKDMFVNYTNFGSITVPGKGFEFDENDLIAYQNSTELLLKASEEGFNKDDFKEHIDECCDSKDIERRKKQYNTLNTLINYIGYQSQKMDIEEALNRLDLYLETGNESYISNTGSTRTSMYLLNFRFELKNLLESKGMTLIDFYESLNIEPSKFDSLDEASLANLEKDTKAVIEQIIEISKEQMDIEKITELIQLYIATGDYNLITRKNNLRELIVNSNLKNNLLTLLNNKKITLTEYMNSLDKTEVKEDSEVAAEIEEITDKELQDKIDEIMETEPEEVKEEPITESKEENLAVELPIEPVAEILTPSDNIDDSALNGITQIINIAAIKNNKPSFSEILKDAVVMTYEKYQQKYENHEIDVDGLAIVTHALISGITNNDYSSFTREKDARKNLIDLGNEKIFDTIMDELEIDGIELTDVDSESIELIVKRYLDFVIVQKDESEIKKVA